MARNIEAYEGKVLVTLDYYASRHSETWVARLVGLDKRFTFKREFVQAWDKDRSGSGKTGYNYYLLDDGVYELSEAYQGRAYLRVENGDWTFLTKREVLEFWEEKGEERGEG